MYSLWSFRSWAKYSVVFIWLLKSKSVLKYVIYKTNSNKNSLGKNAWLKSLVDFIYRIFSYHKVRTHSPGHIAFLSSPLLSSALEHTFLFSSRNLSPPGQRDDSVFREQRKFYWILESEKLCKFQVGIYTPELANGPSSWTPCFLLCLMMSVLGESHKLTRMHLPEKCSIVKEMSS